MPSTSTTSTPSPVASEAICSAVDRTGDYADYGICYVSSSESAVLREPKSLIENRIVITPNSEEQRPSDQKLQQRLVDVGVDCLLAVPISYFATVASCGGTTVTFGAAAPLCVFSTVGAATSSLKCGHSIGKMINHAVDPNLNEILEGNQSWKYYETAVDTIDIVAGVPGAAKEVKDIYKLQQFSRRYGKDIARRFSKSESKKIYRELAAALGETFSSQATRRWVNRKGLSLRFTPAVVDSMLQKQLRSTAWGLSSLYDNAVEINKRHELSSSFPRETLVKGSINNALDSGQDQNQNSCPYTIYHIQQARP